MCIASIVASGAMAADNPAPRSAANMDAARSVNTGMRGKQPTVNQRNGANRVVRNVATGRTAITPNVNVRSGGGALRNARNIITDVSNAIVNRALGLSRSAVTQPATVRVAKKGVARSGIGMPARATAVFSDISTLGAGYNNCRNAYNTCMDQFCAGANETYRRCFCSNAFTSLRDKENALDAATQMLASFEDNNLNAVNKTAEEVNAMYSATSGEMAIKNDTSGAAALLSDIGDLLSGKKKATDTQSMTSLTGLSINFSSDLGDIWGASSDSIFNDNSGIDLASLEGVELYNNAHQQCMQLVASSCENAATKNMAKSAYSILINQDCNAYQKKLDAKTEQVKNTVRTAEKYLREARLEEYRSHNSADVNECMDKVERALNQSTACGSDYQRCLDYTGVYVNSTTGEPIYSPRLFMLNELIVLNGTSSDVLTQNPEFNRFLDSKRMYAKSALDSCRDIADTVWTEFKRNALIKISQAQDEKIEEIKMSCVSTMKECYDTQSGALKSFDDTTAKVSGALAARASRDMCSDKVAACAALYRTGNETETCKIDNKTNRITNADKCGLASLMNFVNTVDDVRVAEGCGAAVESYLKDLCTPTSGDDGYPWNCRLKKFGDYGQLSENTFSWTKSTGNRRNDNLINQVVDFATETCGVGTDGKLESRAQAEVIQQLENVYEALADLIGDKCEAADGIWVDGTDMTAGGISTGDYVDSFYSTTFGKSAVTANSDYGINTWGYCIKNTVKARCDAENKRTGSAGYATYDAAAGKCDFTVEYYQDQCEMVHGVWGPDSHCYLE